MLNKLAKPWPLTVGSLIACLLFSACQSTSSPPPVSGHQSANVYASTKELPRRLQRVALLPVYISEYDTQTDNYLDDTYATGLQGQQRFEVVQISRSQMEEWIGKPQVESSSAIPVELFPMIQHQTGAQAVVLVDIYHFQRYQPISVGIRAKLVDLSSGEILWAVDDIYNGGEAAVLQGAREFQEEQGQNAIPDKLDQSYLYSPRRFSKFVAAALFQSIPQRFSL